MPYLWGRFPAKVQKVAGGRALVSFRHPSEAVPVTMWVDASDIGIPPEPSTPTTKLSFFTGGGVRGACHSCGCAFEECECE